MRAETRNYVDGSVEALVFDQYGNEVARMKVSTLNVEGPARGGHTLTVSTRVPDPTSTVFSVHDLVARVHDSGKLDAAPEDARLA